MEEVRCSKCNKLLFKTSNLELPEHIIQDKETMKIIKKFEYLGCEARCPRCKHMNKIKI